MKAVALHEGDYQGYYHIITKVKGLTFISKETFSIKKVEASGFEIDYIKDRDGTHNYKPKWANKNYGIMIDSLVGKEPVRMETGETRLGTHNFFIILNDVKYFYTTKAVRDADYRRGSSLVVQIINLK